MSKNQPISIRISALCGILGPIIGLIFITLSIYYSSWFNWTENWLSDLGGIPGDPSIWASRGIASIIFNNGLVVSGIIGVIFASSLRKIKILNNRNGRIGRSLFILDMFTLCTVGIFPETTGYLHTVVSLIFFFLIAISLLLIGNVLRYSSLKKIGGFFSILGIFSLCSFPFFLIPRPWGSNAIIEMIPIISISIFSIIFGHAILKNKFDLL
ncbi:hypothetical protein AYK24_03230 [Thermoplasmatales archaeon SG8-52-4]|nr:MAG: hypothetical protein AYK24_03230 [Thermoplasmatales archaeon SG8-52-4]